VGCITSLLGLARCSPRPAAGGRRKSPPIGGLEAFFVQRPEAV